MRDGEPTGLVLVLAPHGRDAAVAERLLDEIGVEAFVCGDVAGLAARLDDNVAFAVVTDEALHQADLRILAEHLAHQPSWSDLPFVVITNRGGGPERNPVAQRVSRALGNVVFVERPFHPVTFASVARTAMRGRRRQYEARARLTALRESEVLLSTAMTAGKLGAWELDAASGVIAASELFLASFGLERSATLDRGALVAAVHPEDRAHVAAALTASLAESRDLSVEHRVLRPGGATGWVELRARHFAASTEGRRRLVGVSLDVTERKRSEDALRAAHDTFRHLVERSPFGIITVNADFRLVQVSDGAQKAFENVRPLIGRDFAEAVRILWEEPFASEVISRYRHTLETGEPYRAGQSVEQRHDLSQTEAYDWRIERITLPDGRFGVVCHFYDLSERLRHEEHIKTLMKEVNHRAKNMLSLVTVIARQTAARSTDSFIERFAERIRALATNQDLLVRSEWQSADLEHLIRAQLAHFQDLLDRRIRLRGPAIGALPEAAEKIGMAVHELATNAGKYGALSNDTGAVLITWRVEGTEGDARFVMDWREEGGPAVEAPGRTGFGSMISGTLLASSLNGSVDAEFLPTGLRWRVTCPYSSVSTAWRVTPVPIATGAPRPIAGDEGGVLVVEDDALLAMSLVETLKGAGWNVIGPASSITSALAHLARTRPVVAILDVNLGHETSERVAFGLCELEVPFICVSSYSREQLPDVFREVPLLQKPLDDTVVLDALRSVVDDRNA